MIASTLLSPAGLSGAQTVFDVSAQRDLFTQSQISDGSAFQEMSASFVDLGLFDNTVMSAVNGPAGSGEGSAWQRSNIYAAPGSLGVTYQSSTLVENMALDLGIGDLDSSARSAMRVEFTISESVQYEFEAVYTLLGSSYSGMYMFLEGDRYGPIIAIFGEFYESGSNMYSGKLEPDVYTLSVGVGHNIIGENDSRMDLSASLLVVPGPASVLGITAGLFGVSRRCRF